MPYKETLEILDVMIDTKANEIMDMLKNTVNKKSKIFNFDEALKRLRAGQKLCREGWNGKGMWVVLQKGYPDGIPINKNTAEATGIPEGTKCKFLPYLMMRTAQGDFVPWLASQTDLLSNDWQEFTE